MRNIKYIILHCSATKEGKEYHAADIERWHKSRGFTCIGYHYVIGLDGSVEKGRPVETVGAHALGYNAESIGVCYIGGLDSFGKPKDTRTNRQKFALSCLLTQLHARFPDAIIVGHNEVAKKACPCFNASEYRRYFDQEDPSTTA